MINPSGIWPAPHAEDQFSHVVPKDSDACVSYSVVHAVESFIKQTLGVDVDFSERFLAKMSGTTLDGNNLESVVNALKKYGLVMDTDWPEPYTFTWDEYYAAIPQEIIDKGKATLAQYVEVGNISVVNNLAGALQTAPCIIFTPSGVPSHARCVLSANQVFDSYPPYIETMPTDIYGIWQIELTAKTMPKLFTKTANIDGEVGVFISTDEPSGLALLNGLFSKNLTPDAQGNIATDIVAHKQ